MTQGFAKKKSEYEKLQNKFEQIKKSHDAKQEQVRKEEDLLQTLTTGLSAEEGHENGYMEQLQGNYLVLFIYRLM